MDDRIETVSIEKLREICCDFGIDPEDVYVEEMTLENCEYDCRLKIIIRDFSNIPRFFIRKLTGESSVICHEVWSRSELYDLQTCKKCRPLLLPENTPLTEVKIVKYFSETSLLSEELAEWIFSFMV